MMIPIRGAVYLRVEVTGNWMELESDDRAFLSKCIDRFRDIAAEAYGRESIRLSTESLEARLGLTEPKETVPREGGVSE